MDSVSPSNSSTNVLQTCEQVEYSSRGHSGFGNVEHRLRLVWILHPDHAPPRAGLWNTGKLSLKGGTKKGIKAHVLFSMEDVFFTILKPMATCSLQRQIHTAQPLAVLYLLRFTSNMWPNSPPAVLSVFINSEDVWPDRSKCKGSEGWSVFVRMEAARGW